jgi:hypothetical protein
MFKRFIYGCGLLRTGPQDDDKAGASRRDTFATNRPNAENNIF